MTESQKVIYLPLSLPMEAGLTQGRNCCEDLHAYIQPVWKKKKFPFRLKLFFQKIFLNAKFISI